MPIEIITQNRNYLPIDIDTRFHSCLRRVKNKRPIKKILNLYHIKKASFYRWLKIFDGTKESLIDKSHRPISPHPNKLKYEIEKRILNLYRRNTNVSYIEIWARLKHDGINVSSSSALRTLKRNNAFSAYKPAKKKHNKVYFTPQMVHEKWQVGVKFVPSECKSCNLEGKFYQYTILDEYSRKRVLYFCQEHSMFENIKFFKICIFKVWSFSKRNPNR